MKQSIILFTIIMLLSKTAYCQTNNSEISHEKAIINIKHIFEAYTKHRESTDTEENKHLMTKSLQTLTLVTDRNELELLLNVWKYYDPTDYPTHPQVYSLLKKSRPQSTEAVKYSIDNKKEWETDNTAPYSDLKNLLQQLENEQE